MYIYLLCCPIAAAATESPSCPCNTRYLSQTACDETIFMINFVSKKRNLFKKGGVQATSPAAPQLQTKHHHSHRLVACQFRVPSVSCSPIAL